MNTLCEGAISKEIKPARLTPRLTSAARLGMIPLSAASGAAGVRRPEGVVLLKVCAHVEGGMRCSDRRGSHTPQDSPLCEPGTNDERA